MASMAVLDEVGNVMTGVDNAKAPEDRAGGGVGAWRLESEKDV